MKVTGKNYDSDFCGSLPLHNINLIQPYGYLLVLNREDFSIIQVSENIDQLLGVSAQELVKKDFSSFIDSAQVEVLRHMSLTAQNERRALTFSISYNESSYAGLVHYKKDYIILEIEPANQKTSFIDIFQELKNSLEQINRAVSVKEVSEISVKELKKLSGFNKIMMYQFDENWNGTVIAEESDEGLESYLDLTFPASDIPRQARELYLKNPYRLIPDRDFTPVRLYPVRNPVTNSFLDLSDCNLRSVPAVHLEYLKNMDVRSSMSTRVIIDENLWGLISCHHQEAKNLTYEECSMFELLSGVISARISSIRDKEQFDFKNSLRETRTRLFEQVYSNQSLVKGLLHDEANIMNLLNAGGAVVVQNGVIDSIGQVPNQEEIRNLVMWFQNKSVDNIFAETNLVGRYDHAGNYAKIGSGIMVIPIDQKKGDFVIAFRPETVTTVNWGGNPDEAINFEADGKKYHPRNSFRLWKETVYQTSLPWHKDELAIAEEVKKFIFEYSSNYIYN